MPKVANYYKTLGVHCTAEFSAIRKAYLERASRTHPDVIGGSVEAFEEVLEAYGTLSNSVKRRAHDDQLKLYYMECPECRGTGECPVLVGWTVMGHHHCPTCSGGGYVDHHN